MNENTERPCQEDQGLTGVSGCGPCPTGESPKSIAERTNQIVELVLTTAVENQMNIAELKQYLTSLCNTVVNDSLVSGNLKFSDKD